MLCSAARSLKHLPVYPKGTCPRVNEVARNHGVLEIGPWRLRFHDANIFFALDWSQARHNQESSLKITCASKGREITFRYCDITPPSEMTTRLSPAVFVGVCVCGGGGEKGSAGGGGRGGLFLRLFATAKATVGTNKACLLKLQISIPKKANAPSSANTLIFNGSLFGTACPCHFKSAYVARRRES